MLKQIKFYDFVQRSPEWYKIREGKITSTKGKSILGELMTKKGEYNKKTIAAIENLAMELAIESKYGMIENDYVSFDMQRGIDQEPAAIIKLADVLSERFIDVSKIGYVEYNEHIGSSLDGICSDNFCVEAKCPNLANFFKLQIKYGLIGNECIDEDHYNQMQHHLMCSDTDGCRYINYLQHKGEEYYLIMEVQRDEERIQLIQKRCEMVIDLKLKYSCMI